MPTGNWIKEKLIEAGDRGCVCADLHRERKELGSGVFHKNGTYAGFARLWWVLKTLGWIEPTGEQEVSFIKGTTIEFSRKGTTAGIEPGNVPRIYFRITAKGLAASDTEWTDPLGTLYPHWRGSRRRIKYRPTIYPRRGRPRIAEKRP